VAPGDLQGIDTASIDVAFSTSCFPHCGWPMQLLLLGQVVMALRRGGAFYLEHVRLRPGFSPIVEGSRDMAGGHAIDPAEFQQVALRFGLETKVMTNADASMGEQCPLTQVIFRMVKQ
jgi:hypothetical protein